MAYTLTHTDGTFLGNISDGQADGIDNTAPGNPTYPLTNLVLFGRNYSSYGLPMNDNFVTLLENSASNTPPLHPLKGQLWWDKGNVALNVYSGTSWNSASGGTPSSTPLSNPRAGQLWWDTTNQLLKVWNGTVWTVTGSDSGNANVSNQTATITVLDNLSNPHIVTTIAVNGSVTTVLSKDSVFLTSDSQITGFGTIGPGINILPSSAYWGTLGSGANSLKSATTIVNVSSATAPTAGQVLTATSDIAANWQTPSGGSPFATDIIVNNPAGGGITVGTGAGNDVYSVAVGNQTLSSDTLGTYNTAIGAWALQINTTGSQNIALGSGALLTNSTGNYNIGIGFNAGSSITTENYNVILGGASGTSIVGLNNHIIIADGQGNERIQVDNTGIITMQGLVGLKSYLKGSLPSATVVGQVIYVSDATGAHVTGSMCFSNATGTGNWIDVTTGNIVA